MSETIGVRPALTMALGLIVALTSGACGYSLAGRGSFLPSYIQTIGVPLFVNNTPVFEIEEILTQKVRTEFIGRGKYRVLPDATGVDGLLIGEVTSVTLSPTSFTEQQQAARYIITLVVKIEFRDVREGKILWESPGLVFREEYDVTSGSNALDPNAFFGQESNALERVASDFARTVVSAILETF